MLFGFRSETLSAIADAVTRALGVTFELHDGMWRGGDYYIYELSQKSLVECAARSLIRAKFCKGNLASKVTIAGYPDLSDAARRVSA